MAKWFWIIVLALVLPDWLIGFVVIGIPVLVAIGAVFGGGAYGLIRGFRGIWR